MTNNFDAPVTRRMIRFQAASCLTVLLFCLLWSNAPRLWAQGTAFTYQGRLNQNGSPANGLYDLQFTVYDAASSGNTDAPPVSLTASVSNGVFTAVLDFGPGVFTGLARWLQIGVRTNGSAGGYTLLQPRQEVMPTPYALYAPQAGLAQGVPPGSITSAQLATNSVGEPALSSSLLAKVNAFLVWQAQTLPVVISSNSVPVPAGYPFDFDVLATNFPPFSFNLTGVPNGLTVDAFDTFAEISGLCTNLGSFPVLIAVGNVAGTITTNLLLTVSASAPTLQDMQSYYARYLHGEAEFDAAAYGFPLAFQWQKNGTNLAGATGTSLVLSNLALVDTAVYSITASNYLGVATTNLQLNVNNLAAWGYFCDGGGAQDTAPPALTNVMAAANNCGIVALTTDFRIYRWDDNGVDPVFRLTNAVAVAAGQAHYLTLRANGTVFAWGDNSLGQTNVPSNATNVVAVIANQNTSVALKSDGTVVYWGDDPNSEFTPPPNATNIDVFAKGDSHSLALRGDTTVVAWGDDTYGQIDVPPGLTNVVGIAAGVTHSLALLSNGTVTGWGDTNALGFPSGLSNVVAIAAGDSVSLALRSDGTWTWWADPTVWSDTDFITDLPHAAAITAGEDDFTAIINDAKSFGINGKVSTSFSYQIQPSGKSKYFALGLPPGLGVNTSTGVVSGTPTKAGTWSSLLGTRSAVTNAAQVFSIQISP